MYPYNYDISFYLQQLHQYITNQNQRIDQMEQVIKQLQTILDEIKQKPSTHIDRIEYKFDQLKVETLEGTLNIGLSPTNGEQIEEFAVTHGGTNSPDVRNMQPPLFEQAEKNLYDYLEEDCFSFIQQIEHDGKFTLTEGYSEFIVDDIRKQIPDRINYYLKQYQNEQRNPMKENEIYDHVIMKIKKEIQESITTFINHLPENMKVGTSQ